MRHVDEGTIHAWLDDEIADPAERAWIEEHLRWCTDCAARVDDERATFQQASVLLSVTAPSNQAPSFHELLARAESALPDRRSAETVRSRGRQRWLLQAGWAASLLLAAAIGWTARELTGNDSARPDSVPPVAQRAESTPARTDQAVSSPRAIESANTADAANSFSALPTPPAATGGLSQRRGASAPPAIGAQEMAAAAASQPEPQAQAESAPREPGAILGRPSAAARQAVVPPAAAPAAPPPSLPERLTVTGDIATRTTTNAEVIEWRTLPRTEAAARSGMPLYGIDGLPPVLTAVSADDRRVRTVYRIQSGATVELEQQRADSDIARPSPAVQPSARALRSGGSAGIAADTAAAAPRLWSDQRGDVRLTLRTMSGTIDLNEVGAKLRVD